MDDIKLRVMSCVLKFLKNDLKEGNLCEEHVEGLEVAIQCLQNIYDINGLSQLANDPSLTELFKFYLQNQHLNRREVSLEEKAKAEELKRQANAAMGEGRYVEALHLYTQAIEHNPRSAVYYCNRAAAKSRLNDHTAAVRDCNIAIELDPNYSKAYGRLGLAYCGLERYVLAAECYRRAHELEPENEGFKNNLDLARQRVRDTCGLDPEGQSPGQEEPAPSGPSAPPNPPPIDLSLLFGNPQLVQLASQLLSSPTIQSFSYMTREVPDLFRQVFGSQPPGPSSPQQGGSSGDA